MLKQILSTFIFLLVFSAADAQIKNATFYYKSGIQFKNNNKFPEALTAFNKAVSLNRKFDSAYVEIGNVYVKLGNVDYSINNYKRALSINPKYTAALIAMGKTYRDSRQNLDSALYYYSAALKTDKGNKETLYSIAWCYNSKNEYDSAISYAVKALEIDNNYRLPYGELGHAYRATKKYTEAIEQFKKNIAISPVDIAFLYTGYCYIELNDKDGALRQYEELKKINEKMAASLKKKIDAVQ